MIPIVEPKNEEILTSGIPAPPMVGIMITQLEAAVAIMPAPEYVKAAGDTFVAALKTWAEVK